MAPAQIARANTVIPNPIKKRSVFFEDGIWRLSQYTSVG